jgi:hypothetical protein
LKIIIPLRIRSIWILVWNKGQTFFPRQTFQQKSL